MFVFLLGIFFACNESEVTYACTDEEVLQECDANGENCLDYEDCAADGYECHAEMGHCMAHNEEDEIEDTGM